MLRSCDPGSNRKNLLKTITTARLLDGRFPSLTGFVLAGGYSRRMGRNNAAPTIENETMLDRQVRLLRSVARRIVVVGGSGVYLQKFEAPVVQDIVHGRGPLGGIYTAVLQTRTEYNFVLGCDLPFISRRLLRYITNRAVVAESDTTLPLSCDGRLQPLCGVYRRRARYAVQTSIVTGRNKVSSFFSRVRCTVIPWRDLAQAGFRTSIFDNMNTLEDYECVRCRLEGAPEPLHN